MADDLLYVFFGKLRAPGNLLNDLLIVVGAAQMLRQTASKLSAAAAELPADGNDPIHPLASFSFRSVLLLMVILSYQFWRQVASVSVRKRGEISAAHWISVQARWISIQSAAPTAVGKRMANDVHLTLRVSFQIVKQVVPQGK